MNNRAQDVICRFFYRFKELRVAQGAGSHFTAEEKAVLKFTVSVFHLDYLYDVLLKKNLISFNKNYPPICIDLRKAPKKFLLLFQKLCHSSRY